MLTCTASDKDVSSAGSSSSWRSVTDEVSVVVLTSATVDSPHGRPVSADSAPPPPPLDGDRADVLPFRSTGGVSVRSCTYRKHLLTSSFDNYIRSATATNFSRSAIGIGLIIQSARAYTSEYRDKGR